MIDVDHFKRFNDEYGHMEGDDCLKRVARSLSDGIRRAGEVVARYGGEEFVALLPGSDRKTACQLAESLRARVEALGIVHAKNTGGVATISLGVASSSKDEPRKKADLLGAADAAL